MSASTTLLKSPECLKRARSVALAKAQTWWRVFAKIIRALRRPSESYKPEVHYMRGPGPKFRKRHPLPMREIKEPDEPRE